MKLKNRFKKWYNSFDDEYVMDMIVTTDLVCQGLMEGIDRALGIAELVPVRRRLGRYTVRGSPRVELIY